MSMRQLDFQPEPIEAIRARLPKAFDRGWDTQAIAAAIMQGSNPDRPALHRENVFDFEDGFRMVAFRELCCKDCGKRHDCLVFAHGGFNRNVTVTFPEHIVATNMLDLWSVSKFTAKAISLGFKDVEFTGSKGAICHFEVTFDPDRMDAWAD